MHLHTAPSAPSPPSATAPVAPTDARRGVAVATADAAWEVPRVSTGWALALAVVTVLLALAVSPPWLPAGIGAAVRAGFTLVCHQIDVRSFHAHGVAFAVCQRCTGIYAGLFAGVLAWPLVRGAVERWMSPRVVWVLALACVPIGIDWALGATGLWANTPASQAATGGMFGLVAGVLAARGAAQIGGRSDVAPVRAQATASR